MTCEELEKLSNEEIFHKPEYTEEFNQITEEQKDLISYQDEKKYLVNPEQERKFENEIRTKKGNHFKICSDPNCQRLKKVWSENKSLSKFVNE